MTGRKTLFSGVLLIAGLTVLFATPSGEDKAARSFLPSIAGVSASFGLGCGMGEGISPAKEALLETGSDSAKIAGAESWAAEVFALWPVSGDFGVGLDLSLSPLAFALLGFDAARNPAEGVRYSYLSLNIAPLASYSRDFHTGLLSVMAGPLLGIQLTDGQVTGKTEDAEYRYSVPLGSMLRASLGGMLKAQYSVRLGPGFLDLGILLTYHYSSVRGYLTDDLVPVHILTPFITAGYSFREEKNGSKD